MPTLPDLDLDDYRDIASLLRETIAYDRWPLSPRIRRFKQLLAKIEPPTPKAEPLPQLKPAGEPSQALRKLNRRRTAR